MSNEWSPMVKMIIVGVLLGVTVAIIFGIVSSSKPKIDESLLDLDSRLQSLSTIELDTYDQGEVLGTGVQQAITQFKNRQIAIIVQTGTEAATTSMNYNCLIAGTNTNTFVAPTLTKPSGSNYYTITLTFDSDGNAIRNNNYRPTKLQGSATYVRPSARFVSMLLKDSTGEIRGVKFVQTK